MSRSITDLTPSVPFAIAIALFFSVADGTVPVRVTTPLFESTSMRRPETSVSARSLVLTAAVSVALPAASPARSAD